MITEQLLATYPLISDQVNKAELAVLLSNLEQLLRAGRRGNVVEFGCYKGTTSLFIRRLLDAYEYDAEFHVYDSFAGLPPKTAPDNSAAGDQFVTGKLNASKKEFVTVFKKTGLVMPRVHKGWFKELSAADVPGDIMFAFLDGDYYESIRDSFKAIQENLQPAAVVIVDDYVNEALPGAARATDEWRAHHAATCRVQSSLAVLRLTV